MTLPATGRPSGAAGGHPDPRLGRLVVAVLTFRRPGDIASVLPLLTDQAESVLDSVTSARVLVVDNDPAASAGAAVRAFAEDVSVPVDYRVESVPGIAAARNRALDEAAGEDLLVFLDDDERPTPGWLSSLLTTYRRYGCAAVAGPVVSEFADEPDSWITAGRFFVRRRLPTGSPLDVAATNNLLLDLHQVRALGLRFAVDLGISGGEDTLFTRTLAARGSRMVWDDEAVVTDVVPPERATRSWVVRRAFSSGNTWTLTSLRLAPGPRRPGVRVGCTVRGVARIAGGAARTAFGWGRGSTEQRARGVRTLARGAGMLSGALGFTYLEYRRPATTRPQRTARARRPGRRPPGPPRSG